MEINDQVGLANIETGKLQNSLERCADAKSALAKYVCEMRVHVIVMSFNTLDVKSCILSIDAFVLR